jgi:predicted nucleic acid-binding protein
MVILREINGRGMNYMRDKIFLDTNILIYSCDQFEKSKMQKSRLVLEHANNKYFPVISTQVMQEFYVVATKKLHADPVITKNILKQFENVEVVITHPELIYDAIDCSVMNRLSFWDALIIVAAESAKCKEIWTEDLNTGQSIRGIKIINPFDNLG